MALKLRWTKISAWNEWISVAKTAAKDQMLCDRATINANSERNNFQSEKCVCHTEKYEYLCMYIYAVRICVSIHKLIVDFISRSLYHYSLHRAFSTSNVIRCILFYLSYCLFCFSSFCAFAIARVFYICTQSYAYEHTHTHTHVEHENAVFTTRRPIIRFPLPILNVLATVCACKRILCIIICWIDLGLNRRERERLFWE